MLYTGKNPTLMSEGFVVLTGETLRMAATIVDVTRLQAASASRALAASPRNYEQYPEPRRRQAVVRRFGEGQSFDWDRHRATAWHRPPQHDYTSHFLTPV